MGHSIVFVEKCLNDTVVLFANFEDRRQLYEELLPSSRLIPYYLVAVVEDVQGHLILLVIIIVIVVIVVIRVTILIICVTILMIVKIALWIFSLR